MKKLFLSLALSVALFLGVNSAALAQASFTAKDAAGATQTFKSINCSAQICPITVLTDVTGAAIYGTAGAANANVLTVQGIASMTPILVNPGTASLWGVNTLGSTTSGQSGQLALGAVTTAAPTYVTAQSNALSLTTGGLLRVDGSGVTQPVSLTSTTITGTVAVTQSGAWSLSANQSVNVAQINGVTPLMGNGVTGAGSPRVTIASDNTAFAVNATLSAETTKVIGTVNVAAAQTIAVTQATSSNLKAQVDPLTASSWGIGTSTQNSATVANGNLVLGQFNTTPTTITTGNMSPFQLDSAGNLLVNVKAGGGSGGTSSSFAAAFPATGTAVGMSQGGNMVAMTGTSGNLNVQCANCSGSGVSTVDAATFTPSTSLFAGGGGFFQTTPTNNALTNLQQGMFQLTANRAIFSNLRNASGAEVGIAGAELFVGGRGTAGSAVGGVLTVQGVASMTPILATATLNAETTKVIGTTRTVGNVGGVLDAIGQNVAAPANWLQAGCQFNTSPTTITTGNGSPLQCDSGGRLIVNVATALGLAAGSTTSGQTGSLVMGAVTTAAPSYTTAQTNYLSLTTAGGLRSDIASVGGTALANFGSAPGAVPAVPVNANVQPTENHVGEIGSNQIAIPVAATVTASAYAAGNALGGLQTIANAARVSGSLGAAGTGGILTGMNISSKALQSAVQIDIFIFNANPSGSTCTDKTAFVLAAADANKVIGVLTVPSTPANGAGWFGGGTGSIAMPTYYPVTYDLASATSLFACGVVRAALTPASTSDISYNYNVLRN